jgi:hypothetical protein
MTPTQRRCMPSRECAAQRYADAFTDARVTLLEDCCSFTAEDQPEALADAIGGFVI